MDAAALTSAFSRARARLENAERRLGADMDIGDAAGLAILADAELALTSLGVTIGMERRGAILRQRRAESSLLRNS